MHDARAVRQRDVTVTYHIPALFLRLYECEQRLVFFIFQIASCIGLQHRISALAQYGIRQSLRQIIDGAVPVHAHLDITLIRGLYGVTYPTVRLRLDRLIQKIHLSEDTAADPYVALVKRLAVADKLDFDTAKLLIQSYKKTKGEDA